MGEECNNVPPAPYQKSHGDSVNQPLNKILQVDDLPKLRLEALERTRVTFAHAASITARHDERSRYALAYGSPQWHSNRRVCTLSRELGDETLR
jgi:hypothetical protein